MLLETWMLGILFLSYTVAQDRENNPSALEHTECNLSCLYLLFCIFNCSQLVFQVSFLNDLPNNQTTPYFNTAV